MPFPNLFGGMTIGNALRNQEFCLIFCKNCSHKYSISEELGLRIVNCLTIIGVQHFFLFLFFLCVLVVWKGHKCKKNSLGY